MLCMCIIRTGPFLRREGPESEPATACLVPRVLRSLRGGQCRASLQPNSLNSRGKNNLYPWAVLLHTLQTHSLSSVCSAVCSGRGLLGVKHSR